MTSPPILQVAAKALIVNKKGEILLVREASTGKNNTQIGLYGLVGGRLDAGESFYDGLRREVFEETGLQVQPIKPLYVGEWRPVIRGVEHQIVAVFMLCEAITEVVRLSDEHDEYRWIDIADRTEVAFMEPDDVVVDAYVQELRISRPLR